MERPVRRIVIVGGGSAGWLTAGLLATECSGAAGQDISIALYVLVQMEMTDETWHLVKDVPKVMGFIGGTKDKPAPISDKEAQAILQSVQEGTEKPKPKVLYEPGEVVRVTDGPFNDFNGVVEEVDYAKNRLKVAVLIFGRSTPVDLDFGQVEKA